MFARSNFSTTPALQRELTGEREKKRGRRSLERNNRTMRDNGRKKSRKKDNKTVDGNNFAIESSLTMLESDIKVKRKVRKTEVIRSHLRRARVCFRPIGR